MAKNRMIDIAKMFGVELLEKFDISYCNYNPYHFDYRGFS